MAISQKRFGYVSLNTDQPVLYKHAVLAVKQKFNHKTDGSALNNAHPERE
jgi:hypothetical protein